MAGRIPQAFIDELLSRVDIVDVIESRLTLKKAGHEYKACCPFHSEKTPSFTVSPTKQFYHCFGCGAHGTAISFLMEYEHLSFPEAIEELAGRTGVPIPKETAKDPAASSDNSKQLYEVLTRADRYFREQLRQHPQAGRAVEYLKGRGLSGRIAAEFGIGFAPPGWQGLAAALGGTPPARLVTAGLLIERDDGSRYDRFRDRIMFPIRDRRGRVIGFGGRVLGEGTPKYLNSPETPVFHKGRELYGLFEAREALRQLPRLLVVEGYMDVVSLAQFGIRYAVATLGTSVTSEHLAAMFRATGEVVFCFDGDRAGRDAAWRGLEQALPMAADGREVRFMFLPDGEDPDTLVRRVGPEAFEEAVATSQPLAEFVVDQLSTRADLSRMDGPARLVELTRPLLSKLPAGAYRQALLENVASRSRMAVAQLAELLGLVPVSRSGRMPKRPPRQAGQQAPSPVRHAIALLLQAPRLAARCESPQRLQDLPLPGIDLLIEMIGVLHARPEVSAGALLEHWRDREEYRHLSALLGRTMGLEDGEALEREFDDTLARLERYRRELRLESLKRKPFRALTESEKSELQRLLIETKLQTT